MRFILRWSLLSTGVLLLLMSAYFSVIRTEDSTAWRILFWGDEDLYQVDIGGQRLEKLMPFDNPTYWIPQWSYDNQWIIYDGDDGAVYRTNASRTQTTQLTSPTDNTYDGYSTWSPVSHQFAFIRGTYYDADTLYLGDENDVQALTDDKFDHLYSLHWSPDGKQLVFEAKYDGVYDIFVYKIDTAQIFNLTGDAPISNKIYPTWSPDSQWVSFVADDDEHDSIMRVYIVRADGRDLHPISPLELDGYIYEAIWSPTGEWIAVLNDDWSTYNGVYFDFFSPDGSQRKTIRLGEDMYVYEEEWTWSPDGQWLIFNDDWGYIQRLDIETAERTIIAQDEDEFFYYPGIAPAIDMPWHRIYLFGMSGIIFLSILLSFQRYFRAKEIYTG